MQEIMGFVDGSGIGRTICIIDVYGCTNKLNCSFCAIVVIQEADWTSSRGLFHSRAPAVEIINGDES